MKTWLVMARTKVSGTKRPHIEHVDECGADTRPEPISPLPEIVHFYAK
jgi:hypothetical protein